MTQGCHVGRSMFPLYLTTYPHMFPHLSPPPPPPPPPVVGGRSNLLAPHHSEVRAGEGAVRGFSQGGGPAQDLERQDEGDAG